MERERERSFTIYPNYNDYPQLSQFHDIMIIYYLYPNSTIIIPSLVNHRRPLPAYPTACGCHWRAPRVWMATPAACCQWRWGNWRRPVAVGWISSGWADLWWFYYEKIGIFIICLSMKLNLTGISWEFTGQKWGLEAWVCLKTAKFRRWTFSYTSCFDVQQDKPISDISFPIKIAKNEMGGSPPPFWDISWWQERGRGCTHVHTAQSWRQVCGSHGILAACRRVFVGMPPCFAVALDQEFDVLKGINHQLFFFFFFWGGEARL